MAVVEVVGVGEKVSPLSSSWWSSRVRLWVLRLCKVRLGALDTCPGIKNDALFYSVFLRWADCLFCVFPFLGDWFVIAVWALWLMKFGLILSPHVVVLMPEEIVVGWECCFVYRTASGAVISFLLVHWWR